MRMRPKEIILWAGTGVSALAAFATLNSARVSAVTSNEYGDRVRAEYNFEDSHKQALHAQDTIFALGATLVFGATATISGMLANDERQVRNNQQLQQQEQIAA